MTETIVSKKARDGQPLTIALAETGGTASSWTLDIRKGGRQVARVQTRPVVLETPAGGCTHGLVVNPATRTVVGLTRAEAQAVADAIDAHKASTRPSSQAVAEAVAAFHCKSCGKRLSSFDLDASPVEGYDFDCA